MTLVTRRPGTRPRFRLADLMVPRHPRSAQQLMRVLTWAAAGVTAGFTLLGRVVEVNATPFWFLVVPTCIVLLALALHRHRIPTRSPVWVGVPLLAVVVITGLNLGTGDATAAAQVFYTIPVLYAGANLRPAAAAVVTAAAILGDAVVAFALLPMSYALTDVTFVSLVLVAISVMLVRAGQRHDRLVERFRGLAEVDQLTGLATRRAFNDAAAAVLDAAVTGSPSPGTALVLVDLDHFKNINDTHGHLVGDDALVHVADVIRSCTRPDAVIGRIGGDEIVVLLPHCDRPTAFDRGAHFVSAIRSHPLFVEGTGELELTISVGVAHAPGEGTTFRELFAVADARLYDAKRDGRDQVGGGAPDEVPLPFA